MIEKIVNTRFTRPEDGGVTVLNLYLCIAVAILAGIAIDMSSLVQARNNLQVAADAAAHAALTTRELSDKDTAKNKALEVAAANMPASYGVGLELQDIQFGTYDQTTRTFTVDDDNSREAVYVMTERALADSNGVSSFLLDFIGFGVWDVRTSSVYETFIPACFREGFVAQSRVDIQSLNNFTNGFCIHSNSHVEVNQNNTFQTGVIVSMPNAADLVVPANSTQKNAGLDKALRSSKYDIKILKRLNDIKAGVNNPASKYYRTFLTSTTPISRSYSKKTTTTMADYTAGRMYDIRCNGNADLTLNGAFSDIVILTDCAIKFGSNAVVENSTIITEDTSNDSWKSPSGLRLGKDDSCAPGGSTQLLAYGSVSQASGLEIYGSQIIVAGDMDFAAGATGEGAAVVAGGEIDGTSGMNMSYCGANMGENFLAEYFRLAG